MSSILENYLLVGTVLFSLGALGFLTRRNLIVMILSGEMMLTGVSINFVAFSKVHHNLQGQIFTIFILTVASCEAGLALALLLVLYQRKKSLDVDLWQDLGESPAPPAPEAVDPDENIAPVVEPSPTLQPSGKMPGELSPVHATGAGRGGSAARPEGSALEKSLRQETARRV